MGVKLMYVFALSDIDNTIQYNKNLCTGYPHSTKVGVTGGPVYKLITIIKIKFGCSVTKPPGLCRSQTAN